MTVGVPPLTSDRASISSSMDTLRIIHDASDPISIRPSASTSPCVAHKKKPLSVGHYSDDEDTTQLRNSTGSLSSRDDIDWARHTFAALPSSLQEIARRSADGLYDTGSQSMPPRSAPTSSSSRTNMAETHFQQHLRNAYGRHGDFGSAPVAENDRNGDAFVDVTNPDPDTMWIRGKAAGIEWRVLDNNVERVQIELLERGSSASTIICKDAPNNGGFLYTKVPWGMACGDDYFLRISSVEDPARYMTTRVFSIGTDP